MSKLSVLRNWPQSLAVACILVLMGTSPTRADALCGRTFSSLEQLRKEVIHGPKTTIVSDSADLIQIADHKERVFWTFLKPNHPGAPAAVCLIPTMHQGAPSFWMHARCGGPNQACDAFIIEEFHTKRALALKRLEGL